MIVELLTEHRFEFLSLKGGCRGLSESTHVKMSDCWKSDAAAHILSASEIDINPFSFIKMKFYFCCQHNN